MAAEQIETTILLRLVDRQQISLSDPVSKWFPNYPHANEATLRMLAASSSGFGDYVLGRPIRRWGYQPFGDLFYQHPYRRFTARQLIRRSQAPYQEPQYTNSGGDWQYSHTNFVMLGAILEKITGRKYGTLVRKLITKPLGLDNTVFPSTSKIQRPVLHAFTSERGAYEDSTYWRPSWTFSQAI
ncbi:MAG: serine hydrolase domain-containing protein [Candidatus Binataceae bacterium]